MATPKRRPAKKTSAKDDSPLAAKQREIKEKAAKLEAQMARCQKLLDEAPKLQADRARKAREEFVIRMSRTEQRGGNRAAAPYRKYDLDPGAPARQKRLRAERNRGRFMFFVLLTVFSGVMAWLYFSVIQHS